MKFSMESTSQQNFYNNTRVNQNEINNNFIVLFFYSTLIVDLIRKINDIFLGFSPLLIELIRNLLYIVIFCYIIYHAYYNNNMYSIVIISLSYIILLLGSYIINPQIKPLILETTVLFITRCLCGFYMGLYMPNPKELLQKMLMYSWIAILYAFLILIYNSKINIAENYMLISNNLLLPFLALFFSALIHKKLLYLFNSIFILLIILLFGARSPIFSIIAACIFLFITFYKNLSIYKKFIYIIIFIGGILILLLTYDMIVSQLLQRFPDSRTLILLSQGKILSIEGREIFYENAIKILRLEPFRIRGLFSDQAIFSSILNVSITDGVYAHNIFFEIFLQFGIPLGTCILSILFYNIFRALFYIAKSNENEYKIIFCLISGSILASLLVSGSYITAHLFWTTLGMAISMNYCRKYKLE